HRRLTSSRRGFDIELANMAIEGLLPSSRKKPAIGDPDSGHIEHLIVTTKIHQAHRALEPLKNRLSRESTIAFIQNGMGIIEEINENVFTDPYSRPRYIVGITTHGVS